MQTEKSLHFAMTSLFLRGTKDIKLLILYKKSLQPYRMIKKA